MQLKKQDVLNIFKKPESEVNQFIGALSEGEVFQPADSRPAPESHERKMIEGKVDKVKAPKALMEKVSGFVRIYCGWHKTDYVWHIEPAAIRRPWRAPVERVIHAIAMTMNKAIPKHTEVKIWPPARDFELQTITFKAIDLQHEWRVTEADIDKITVDLFTILNNYV